MVIVFVGKVQEVSRRLCHLLSWSNWTAHPRILSSTHGGLYWNAIRKELYWVSLWCSVLKFLCTWKQQLLKDNETWELVYRSGLTKGEEWELGVDSKTMVEGGRHSGRECGDGTLQKWNTSMNSIVSHSASRLNKTVGEIFCFSLNLPFVNDVQKMKSCNLLQSGWNWKISC